MRAISRLLNLTSTCQDRTEQALLSSVHEPASRPALPSCDSHSPRMGDNRTIQRWSCDTWWAMRYGLQNHECLLWRAMSHATATADAEAERARHDARKLRIRYLPLKPLVLRLMDVRKDSCAALAWYGCFRADRGGRCS